MDQGTDLSFDDLGCHADITTVTDGTTGDGRQRGAGLGGGNDERAFPLEPLICTLPDTSQPGVIGSPIARCTRSLLRTKARAWV